MARILWSAIVNVDFTVLTFVAIWAAAQIRGNQICTGGAILTRGVFALIDFLFASQSLIPGLTAARVVVDLIVAGGSVQAGARCALVNVFLTGCARETGFALASKTVHSIETLALPVARFR